MQRNQKAFIALTDADGCIFNIVYDFLFLRVIASHHNFLSEYGNSPELLDKHKEFIQAKLQQIIAEVESFVQYKKGRVVVDESIENEVIDKVLSDLGYADPEELEGEELEDALAKAKNSHLKYILNFQEMGKKLLDAILFLANQSYFKKIVTRVEAEQFDHFLLMCGSNRQSKSIDVLNSRRNGTLLFLPTLISMCNKFNELLRVNSKNVKCVLD
ncbi:MAG: hypothetical protein KIT56_03925, partial [Gammaproteobacteria bacterium]|nr:hypothetical protein [Gammaproteobacteria bacterium]